MFAIQFFYPSNPTMNSTKKPSDHPKTLKKNGYQPPLVKTNLRWPGGKSKMTRILEKFMPEKIDNYFELFTGGASVLLFIIQKFNPEKTLANDINTNLINYYKTVQKNPQQLIDSLLKIKDAYDSEEFRSAFKKLDINNTVDFFVANKTSFSGLNYNYSKLAYERNFTHATIRKINQLSPILKNVEFINEDFRNFNRELENYFIYMDPPYFSNSKKGLYGKKGSLHKEFDHKRLRDFVNKYAQKNKIMISYDDCPEVREFYKGYRFYHFDFTYSMTNTGGNNCKIGKETVITNYEVKIS
jgi:DNA adenine methylase